mmetsp:Transcript_21733/g.19167  ORF Transcript_21733/g.19167 Transcript_21733/m.19167 type:complete len:409 (+) Transcript_21733:91-1317(+)
MGCCCNKDVGDSSQPLLNDQDKAGDTTATKGSLSTTASTKKGKKNKGSSRTDSKWTNQLKKDAERDKKIKKLLLLGPGNSGKSTFFKQLLRIHGRGLSDLKKQYFGQSDMKRAIYDNVLDQIRAVINQYKQFAESEEYDSKLSEEEEEAISYITNNNLPADCEINKEVANKIKIIWNNVDIKKAYDDRENLSIVDSAAYFFNEIDRISSIDYQPTERDILLVRTPTAGIVSAKFDINGNTFHIYDAGGQKCERSKWIHCFDNVTAVIFIGSLSCFDQGLYETAYTNAMHETLMLWDEILNSRWFRPTSMILFLNKCDLFKIKLEEKNKDLHVCFDGKTKQFDEYKGDNSYKDGIDFVKQQFVAMNKCQNGREIYAHVTCATDKDNVKKVFNDVQNIVVNAALQRGGLL